MGDKPSLRFRQSIVVESDIFAGFADLARHVFDTPPSPPWPVWTLFDGPHCVAGLQCHLLQLYCDGDPTPVAALRNVAVAPAWRGRGLMRDLMARVLPWCDDHAVVTLLYAETPALYARYGFRPLEQHAFEGAAPKPVGLAGARPLDGRRDASLVARLLAARSPASAICGVLDDGGLTAQALAGGEWQLDHDAALDALVAWERDGDDVTLIDIVAFDIPSAARILGSLGQRPARLRTLFSPDRLAWDGAPVADDTGLMARGTLPPAMRRPFMLPPTAGF